MPRIAGVDIPENKKILYSLQYIYGVGPKTAEAILQTTSIDPDRRARELTDEEVASIADIRKHDSLEAFGVAVFKSLDGSDAKVAW